MNKKKIIEMKMFIYNLKICEQFKSISDKDKLNMYIVNIFNRSIEY